MMFKQFGGKITAELKARYEKSPNWRNGSFQNLEETSMDVGITEMPGLLYKLFFEKDPQAAPNQDLAIESFDLDAFLKPSDDIKYIWYGHGVYLMRINNKTLLIDPMLGPDSSPISPAKTRRFSANPLDLIDDFPEIDLMLLTHDHYDHLDLASIRKLIPKIKSYYVALGCGRHLEAWGVPNHKITEFDWWDVSIFSGIKITFTPSRHFSGRGLRDRAKSLWGGWVFKTATQNLFHSGDGGFGAHFKDIGEKLGPFDFGFIECGQYGEKWSQIHMFPRESVIAAIDAKVKIATPYHWAGFKLAFHSWTEPADLFVRYAIENNLNYTLPRLGQLMHLNNTCQTHMWWKDLD
ncbi:MBL fold metallo-hydrolase [Leeuwenhoekiella sp. MAR_2009_132]|uniref:MBL fold metallo-hydrolase n=1 Tax=Leeuwenhoekiella sp. MAR_2009_132 TaxID=1392489 RepID=UPI00049056BC|nr:MBL fold metallo-hydrolase [Leeuwenhoekiella sp. MAR_2009_132]